MSALKKTFTPFPENDVTSEKGSLRLVNPSSFNQDKKIKTFEKGEVLFREGESSKGFYIILKGAVRAYRASKNQDKQQTFKIHCVGSWVGLRDSIGGGKYLHNATALEDTEVQFISESEFRLLLQADPGFRDLVFDRIANESREAENKIYSMGTRQVHAQVAEYLLESMNEQGQEIELPFTREVMASIIGVKTETLVRTLSDLKCRGWIEIDKKKIIVQDKEHLARLLD